MKITTQKLNKILSDAGFLRGKWCASSRVKGWGSQIEGFEVERLYDSQYLDRGSWRRRARRWKEIRTTRGYRVKYHLGCWSKLTGAEYKAKVDEKVKAMFEVLYKAGVSPMAIDENHINIAVQQ